MNRIWTEAELAILRREREAGTKVPVIAKMLDRPVPATYLRAKLIGIIVQPHRAPTDAEKAIVTAMLAQEGSATDAEMAEALGRTVGSVRYMLQTMGVVHARPAVKRAHTVGKPSEATLAARAKRAAERDALRAGVDARRLARNEARNAKEAAKIARMAARKASWEAAAIARAEAAAAKAAAPPKARAPRIAVERVRAVPKARVAAAPKAKAAPKPKVVKVKRAAAAPVAAQAALAARAALDAQELRGLAYQAAAKAVAPAPVAAEALTGVSGRGGWTVSKGRRRFAKPLAPMPEAEKADLIAQFIANRGVTRIAAEPAIAALNRLRSRGRIVVKQGAGYLVDNRLTLANDNELIAYVQEKVTA